MRGVSKRLDEMRSFHKLSIKDEFDIIQFAVTWREGFKQRIDQIMLQQDIVAIVGTLKIGLSRNIPIYPAADLFRRDKILEFQNF